MGPLLIWTARCPPPPVGTGMFPSAFTLSPSIICLCPASLSHLGFHAAGLIYPCYRHSSHTIENVFFGPPCWCWVFPSKASGRQLLWSFSWHHHSHESDPWPHRASSAGRPPAERHDEKLLREVRETQPPPQLCFVTAGKVFPSPSLRFVCWKNVLLV